jgi:hypothetical protein
VVVDCGGGGGGGGHLELDGVVVDGPTAGIRAWWSTGRQRGSWARRLRADGRALGRSGRGADSGASRRGGCGSEKAGGPGGGGGAESEEADRTRRGGCAEGVRSGAGRNFGVACGSAGECETLDVNPTVEGWTMIKDEIRIRV